MVQLSEAARLEQAWAGVHGDAYLDRMASANGDGRLPFWKSIVGRYGLAGKKVLEVGCGHGLNADCLTNLTAYSGIDINPNAIATASQRNPAGQFTVGSALALPYETEHFDLVFSTGVLMHIGADGLDRALNEMLRVSRRDVMVAEYLEPRASDDHAGLPRSLFCRDYRPLLADRKMRFMEEGRLGRVQGFAAMPYLLARKWQWA